MHIKKHCKPCTESSRGQRAGRGLTTETHWCLEDGGAALESCLSNGLGQQDPTGGEQGKGRQRPWGDRPDLHMEALVAQAT